MPDFSVILQSPQMRTLVQEGALERLFHDGLYPQALFRSECATEQWQATTGDEKIFSGKGLMKPRLRPLQPGNDPNPHDYTMEQWRALMAKYADTIDTHMPSAVAACVRKLTEDLKQLGLNAGQTLNRLVRNTLFAAALSGWTVADGATVAASSMRVKRLNGFTRVRRPDLVAGSPVRYDPVSANNPLPITANATSVNVIGFTPDTAGDESGPGILLLSANVTVADRDPVFASTRTSIVRSGGGNSVGDLGGSDILTLANIRAAVARLRSMDVPNFGDGSYHAHLDPTSENQIFADNEFQRLQQDNPTGIAYAEFAIKRILGCIMFRNNECPQPSNVDGGTTATFSLDDPFVGELYNTGLATGLKVHRMLVLGDEAIWEYYADQDDMITEAGVTGKVENGARVTNNGVNMNVERIQVVMRAPQDRLQEWVGNTWKFQGTWVMRTDGATGDAAAFKRCITIEHAEP